MGNLQLPIVKLDGIGKVKAAAFEKLGIVTLSDLLYHFPTRYENRGIVTTLEQGKQDMPQSYVLTVATEPKLMRLRGNMNIVKFGAFDDSASAEVSYFNQPYAKDNFRVGGEYRFYGRLGERKGRFVLTNPVAEQVREGRPLPELYAVYRLASGLNKNVMRACARQAFSLCKNEIGDYLPNELRAEYGLCTLAYALENIHNPDTLDELDRAARRLAFDEMLETALAARLVRASQSRAMAMRMANADLSEFYKTLRFALTNAQKRTIDEIVSDMNSGDGDDAPRMSRIIVGDVGSGKTVCAEAAIYLALHNGAQAALLAPTEILASQHFSDLCPVFRALGYTVEKLTGSTTAAEKRRIKAGIADKSIDLVIGTHALLEEDVRFAALGLAVADEQHRFGIRQRAKLLERSPRAHMLVMSATPIPRTLALVLYGDLDISRIDEMPPGRQKVDTFFVNEGYRSRLNSFIEKQVSDGGQVYVVCPAVEPQEDDAEQGAVIVSAFEGENEIQPPLKSAVAFAETLSKAFPARRVAFLHGKLKAAEKNEIMSRFAAGKIDILVSTTVIEVGINVQNASLMIVENAERFGLSQLHQLRGRVGRGNRRSYCVLVSDSESSRARERLKLLCGTSDGFAIADADLKMRGPGDLVATDGARQSGEGQEFRMTMLCRDSALYDAATGAAEKLLEMSPTLSGDDLAPLRNRMESILNFNDNTIN